MKVSSYSYPDINHTLSGFLFLCLVGLCWVCVLSCFWVLSLVCLVYSVWLFSDTVCVSLADLHFVLFRGRHIFGHLCLVCLVLF